MIIAALSIIGIILGTTYMVWLYYRIGLNEIKSITKPKLYDLELREIATLMPLVVLVLLIGLQPGILLSYMHVSVEHLVEQVHISTEGINYTMYDSVDKILQYFQKYFIVG